MIVLTLILVLISTFGMITCKPLGRDIPINPLTPISQLMMPSPAGSPGPFTNGPSSFPGMVYRHSNQNNGPVPLSVGGAPPPPPPPNYVNVDFTQSPGQYIIPGYILTAVNTPYIK